MLGFLVRHAQTLECVEFTVVCLTSCDWSSVLRQARGIKWAFLGRVILSMCTGNPNIDGQLSVKAYLKRETDIDPIEEARSSSERESETQDQE